MVILRTRNKITDFLMILAWASPFNYHVCLYDAFTMENIYWPKKVGSIRLVWGNQLG